MRNKPLALDYAPLPAWHRRRRWRWGVLWLLFAALGWPLGRFGPAAWKQVDYLSRQQRCMSYAPPSGRVVYEDDPREAARLLTGRGFGPVYIARQEGVDSTFRAPTGARPAPWEAMGGDEAGVTFLHHRRTPAGQDRLVAVVAYLAGVNGGGRTVRLDGTAYMPATWRLGSELQSKGGVSGTGLEVAKSDRLRMYAGRADPNDLSHFTIEYELNGLRGIIDGWLGNDEQLKLKFRQPPVPARVPPRRAPRNVAAAAPMEPLRVVLQGLLAR